MSSAEPSPSSGSDTPGSGADPAAGTRSGPGDKPRPMPDATLDVSPGHLPTLEELVALTGFGSWALDLQTRIPTWSDEVCRLHDVSPGHQPTLDELIGYFSPPARPVIRRAIERSVEDGTAWDLELPLQTAAGRLIWVRSQGRAVQPDRGRSRLVGAYEDITDRKSATEQVRVALDRTRAYEALFRNAGALMAVAALDGTILNLNPAWEAVLGWDLGDLLRRNFTEFLHPDDVEPTLHQLAELVETGDHTVGFENRYRTRDGGYVRLRWLATVDLHTQRMYAVATDITEATRRTAHTERLARIVARTTNAVMITDPSGNIEWINESFSRITGYSPAELLGTHPGRLLQGADTDPREVARVRACILRREPFKATLLNYRKSGEPFWFQIDAQPLIDADGSFSGYMALETDVTEARATRRQLIEARNQAQQLVQEARSATEAKNLFLAVMSHELRTPMNGILGTAELLERSPLDGEQRELLSTLYEAGRSLLSILNDILDYSKFEQLTFQVERAPLDLADTLSSAIGLCRPEAERNGITLEVELASDLPRTILGDRLRLRQLVGNLLGNACKFTDDGQVRVRATRAPGDRLRVEVADTGIGIPADKLDLLFRPFSQVDASAQRRFSGTGLGLAICRRLVALMGGTIDVSSREGAGSTFWFEVPLEATPHEPVPASPRAIAVIRGNHRVLVVEDNPTNGLVLTKMLQHLGCVVETAIDGVEALEVLSTHAFDLVLMDCQMPRLDGWEATRRLRAREAAGRTPRPHTPVIAQTASVQAEDIAHCLDAGMDAVLHKPIQLAVLAEIVARWTTVSPTPEAGSLAERSPGVRR